MVEVRHRISKHGMKWAEIYNKKKLARIYINNINRTSKNNSIDAMFLLMNFGRSIFCCVFFIVFGWLQWFWRGSCITQPNTNAHLYVYHSISCCLCVHFLFSFGLISHCNWYEKYIRILIKLTNFFLLFIGYAVWPSMDMMLRLDFTVAKDHIFFLFVRRMICFSFE